MKFSTVHPKPYIKLRVIATLIDYGIFWVVVWFYADIAGEKSYDGKSTSISGFAGMVIPLFWFFYFVATEALNQATPGHDICKLKVYTVDGQKPSFIRAFKRRICDIFDIPIYGLPAIICISKTPKHQRIGDMLANTVVVKATDVEIREVEF